MSKECGICDNYHSRIICPVCGAIKAGNVYYDGHRSDGMMLFRGIARHVNRLVNVSGPCVSMERTARLVGVTE